MLALSAACACYVFENNCSLISQILSVQFSHIILYFKTRKLRQQTCNNFSYPARQWQKKLAIIVPFIYNLSYSKRIIILPQFSLRSPIQRYQRPVFIDYWWSRRFDAQKTGIITQLAARWQIESIPRVFFWACLDISPFSLPINISCSLSSHPWGKSNVDWSFFT